MKLLNMFSLLVLTALLSGEPIFAQKKPTKMIRINHIALYVSSLESSTRFYEKVVGLDTIPEPFHDGKHTWFSISENAHLHLISGRKNSTEGEKNTHLCFSTAELDNLIKKLTDLKVPYENWAGTQSAVTTRVDGIRQIWFRDPDGYWIEANDDF
jgi:lactoylglutathione lyase